MSRTLTPFAGAFAALALVPLFGVQPAGAQPGRPTLTATEDRDEAATLHVVLLGCHATDPSCRKDLEAVRHFFANTLGALPGSRLKMHDLTGKDWTPARILKALAELPVGPNDNILFYLSGHGEVCQEGQCLNHIMTIDGGKLVRHEVRGVLQKLRPRALILLTDCCSYCGTPNAPIGLSLRTRGVAGPNLEGVRRLFLGARGLIDITAAKALTRAQDWHIGPSLAGADGAFTVALLNVLSDPTQTFTTWEGFFPKLRRATVVCSNGTQQLEALSLGRPLVN